MRQSGGRNRKVPIIAYTAQKGGVGKSTLAMNTAAAFSILGYRVLVVDTDEHQASIRDACSQRDDSNITAICIQTKSLVKELSKPQLKEGVDIIIIDGEGSMHAASRAAIEICDYFVVPLQPSQFDLNSYARYISSVIEPVAAYRELEGGVVLNRTGSNASTRATREALSEYVLPIFDGDIMESDSFREAGGIGLCITEYRPKIKVSKVFFNFFVELCDAVGIKLKRMSFEEFKKRSLLKRTKSKEKSHAAKEENIGTKTSTSELRTWQ